MMNKRHLHGFTLVEMIIVIVITGIIGGMVAMFLRAPLQGYVDSARRAELTDIADTASRRIARDLRLALPNSVRVTGACGAAACFVEFIPTIGGGRYRNSQSIAGIENALDFDSADASFEVLGAMPPGILAGDQIVVYNLGIPGADAYAGANRRAVSAVPVGNVISITSAAAFPFDSCVTDDVTGFVVGGCRFQVVQTPVTYACDGAGNLWRYWGYPTQDVQTKTDSIGELDGLIPNAAFRALMATNVTDCSFIYTAVASERSGLVTMHLTISQAGENVTLYTATHVNNLP